MYVYVFVKDGLYHFEAQLFSDGTPSTGGKGEVYDGYSTWWGSFEPYEREDGTRCFTHEDICE